MNKLLYKGVELPANAPSILKAEVRQYNGLIAVGAPQWQLNNLEQTIERRLAGLNK